MTPSNHDLRAFLQEVDKIGELRRISGIPWDKDMGGLVEMILERSKNPPALLFDKVPGSRQDMEILCSQIDTLPREYCDALLALLDRVPPFSTELVEQVFLETLHASPRDLYQSFDYAPVASASIGQVHRATLMDGSSVAVKVQRPNAPRQIESDLRP